MMKNNFYAILFFMFCLATNAGAAPVTFLFPDGTQVRIQKVQVTDQSFETWKNNDSQLKSMFYAYNYPFDVNEYKSLFHHNGFPEEIDGIYDAWRKKMNDIIITPQAIFFGTLNNEEIACIQYFFSSAGNHIQMSFLSKRVDGKWYPVGGKSMSMHQHVMALFATLQPELISCLITADISSPYNKPAEELRSRCMAGGQQISEACLYEFAEEMGTSASHSRVQEEKLLFRDRVRREMPPEQMQVIEQDLMDYIQAMDIPELDKKRIMYYFSKNESMKAVSIISSFGDKIDQSSLFGDLNRLHKTDHFRRITDKGSPTSGEN